MGDVGRSTSPTEQRFLQDLELAKRLSLTEYENDRERRGKVGPKKVLSPTTTNTVGTEDQGGSIRPRPRPRPCSLDPGGSPVGGGSNNGSSPASISLPPPAPAFRRNRSLPHRKRYNGQNGGDGSDNVEPRTETTTTKSNNNNNNNNNNSLTVPLRSVSDGGGGGSGNEDLITLASPKLVQKALVPSSLGFCDILPTGNNFGHFPPPGVSSISPSQPPNSDKSLFPSSPAGFNRPAGSSPITTTNGVAPSASPSTTTTIGLGNGRLLGFISPSYPGTFIHQRLPPPTSPMNGFLAAGPLMLTNFSNSPSASSTLNGTNGSVRMGKGPSALPPQSLPPMINVPSSAYSALSAQLKFMSFNDDLIDLGGQLDEKNILEFFDPLKHQERVDAKKAAADLKIRQTSTHLSTSSSSTTTTTTEKSRASSSADRKTCWADCESDSGSTIASFSYRSGRDSVTSSLYPSLDEFSRGSLYANLEIDKDCDNVSSFYDNVFNPLEYVQTVSCSSNSSLYDYAPSSSTLQRSIGFSSHITEQVVSSSALPQISEGDGILNAPDLPPRNSFPEDVPSSVEKEEKIARIPPVVSSKQQNEDLYNQHGRLYENIQQVKNYAYSDCEIQAFYEMIKELRFSNRHVDSNTNVGYIRSSTLNNRSIKDLSIKVIVHNEDQMTSDAATFTCDVSATPDMIIAQSIIDFDLGASGRDFMLRVKGMNEYFSTEVPLAKYWYVQECIKLDQDVMLVLVSKSKMENISWARTSKDDADSVSMTLEDIMPLAPTKTITHKEIRIPLEVIDRESERLKEKIKGAKASFRDPASWHLASASLVQGVKAVCCLLGEVQTVEIIDCLNSFLKICNEWNAKVRSNSIEADGRRTKVVDDESSSRKSYVEIVPRSASFSEEMKESVLAALFHLEDAVRHLVEMYSKTFPVSFQMKESTATKRLGWSKVVRKPMSEMLESFLIRVGCAHRLKSEWLNTYMDYMLLAEIYHGTRSMAKGGSGFVSVTRSDNNIFFPSLIFNCWIDIETMPVCILPRESRVVFTLLGRKPNEENSNKMDIVELGWTSIQCFNFKGLLAQGKYLLPFWPTGLVQKKLGPAPDSSFSSDKNSTLLTIEFTDFGYEIPFPDVPSVVLSKKDFKSLDPNTQVMLKDIYENSTFTKFPPEVREVLWEKRHYLHEFPNALPKVLLAAQLWDFASLGELHAMLQSWEIPEPIDALELLLPCFPDIRVREQGVEWVSRMPDEELINLLPQLVEALSFETFDFSPLAKLLLKKALSCLKICHYLFWLLVSAVGLGKWTGDWSVSSAIVCRITLPETQDSYDPKRRRLELMLNSLMAMCGAKWRNALIAQHRLMGSFYDVAVQVKASASSGRQNVLSMELNKVQNFIFNTCSNIPLPLSPSYDVQSIDIKSCSYFNSASIPLKISFNSGLPEKNSVATIYKVGDDLRQDMLTLQIIRVVEKWWLESGLDLRVLTFSCIPTGNRQGFVEMVPNAETLCRIQAEHGLTGAFRDRPIAEWLAKMNPSTLDYRRAVENFTRSCAAYCVVTYILGICDRHNDNIMLTKKGHLFHIDFGKFLGDAQMFGSLIKRDRTPFVLTSDMVYVINDGEKDSSKFHRFVELCCEAFRVVRDNGNTLVNLFALMATAGIQGVDSSSALYVQNALLPDCSNYEASARFAGFIQESLQNWFTPVNFFLHTLAQMPFGADTNDDPTKLSFVPTTYTLDQDGRIEKIEVVGFLKKYDPEKFYLYTVRLRRRAQNEWSVVNRLYKEFQELHSKLCLNFPKAAGRLSGLPRSSGLSRSNVKQVSEKRKVYVQQFLDSLFYLADEISHSTLVYTFFHPLLRDEEHHQEAELERKTASRTSLARNPSRIYGQIKLSVEYTRSALHVLIQHVVDLACPNGAAPSPYVKTYLTPDPGRKTKRKTKVVKKSQHPTFMEMIEYRLPLEVIRTRMLAVSVWHSDPFQENNFLGGVTIPLSKLQMGKEVADTYKLMNIPAS